MLRLANRFTDDKRASSVLFIAELLLTKLVGDQSSRLKEDWVQAKRHVLAVLRIQTGRTLYDVLVSRPEEVDEIRWIEEVHRDIAMENARLGRQQLPPTPVEAGYQIESIRSWVRLMCQAWKLTPSLPFHEVKSRAIVYCIKLEKAGKISRVDNYQGLLVSIASDIRQKHHLRKMGKQNLMAMTKAYDDLRHKKETFDEQVTSYHDYIDSSMASLQQKGWVCDLQQGVKSC
jgi:Ras GTPase-activating-like protein IQGAP2/3